MPPWDNGTSSSASNPGAGFRDPSVLTLDPAMGTGTYLHTVLERVAEQTGAVDGASW